MTRKILVTGATGTVAAPIVPRLVRRGHAVRALVHGPARGDAVRSLGAEVVLGSFDDPVALRAAFDGVDAAFLAVPMHPEAARWNRALFAAAAASGSPHLVRLSAIKASEDGPTDNTRLHGGSDRELRESGLTHTILRPSFFMQNLLASAQSIVEQGAMYWGMGDGRLAMIDARDVTDAALAVLDTPDAPARHGGKTYDLTGPRSITFHEAAAIVAAVTGRSTRYVPVSIGDVVQSLRDLGAGEWVAEVMGQYSRAYAANWGDATTDDVRSLTHHEARSFDTFVREVLAPAMQRGER